MEYNVFNSIYYTTLMVTTVCNLKCKNCVTSTPFQPYPHNIPIQELQADVDRYFEIFHDIQLEHFDLIGGEPLVYPDLPQLAKWLMDRHGDKIGELRILTNGYLKISEKLLDVCVGINMQFRIDDYGEKLSPSASYNCRVLEGRGIRFCHNEYLDTGENTESWRDIGWIDFGDLSYKNYTSEQLTKLENGCSELFASHENGLARMRGHLHIFDGRIYTCDVQIARAKHIQFLPGDYIDLRDGRPIDQIREEAATFKQHLVEYCKYCNGFCLADTNRKPVPAAIQLTKIELEQIRQRNI
jgi:hypothetical protein